MPGPQLCYAHRQRAEPFRPTPRPPPLMGRLLSRASPAQKAPLLGELAELARPEGSRRALRGRPSTGSYPLTPAAAWGQAALRTPFKVACRGGGTPPRGRRGRRPYSLYHYPFACCRGDSSLPARRSSHLDLLILGKIAFRGLA